MGNRLPCHRREWGDIGEYVGRVDARAISASGDAFIGQGGVVAIEQHGQQGHTDRGRGDDGVRNCGWIGDKTGGAGKGGREHRDALQDGDDE